MAGKVTELVFRGDSRSAVRSLMGIAEASDKTTRVLKRNSRESSASLGGIGESGKRLRGTIGGLMGTVGLGGLALGFKDVLSAGESWQAQQAQLRNALQNTGRYSESTMKRLMDAAEALSTHGGFGAQENLRGLTQFVRSTGNASDAVNKVALATNVARSSGRDYQQVLRALLMAEQGRTTGLARLGVAMPRITTAEDALKEARFKHRDALLQLEAAGYKFTAQQKAVYAVSGQVTSAMLAQAKAQDQLATKQRVFAFLQEKYAGSTAAFSRSTSGHISNMRNAWETLQKEIGSGLLPVTDKLLGVLSRMFGWLDRNRGVLYGLLAAVAAVSTVLVGHAVITEVVKAKTYALAGAQRLLGVVTGETAITERLATGATAAFGAAMDALPVLALVTGLVLLATHFDTVKRVATVAWHGIKTAAVVAFHGITGAASAAWKWLTGAASTVFNALTWPFRKAWELISGIFGKIKSAVGTITNLPGKLVHGAGSVLHSATFGLLHGGGPVARHFAYGGPVGSDTIPGWLDKREYVLNPRMVAQAGMGNLEQWRMSGQQPGGNIVVQPFPVIVQVDGRTIAEAAAHYTVKKAARGASSLVGGGMSTGVRAAT